MGDSGMSSQAPTNIAFILSLIGGLVIVVGGIISVLLSFYGSPYGTYYGMGMGMMRGFGFGYSSTWFAGLSIVALVCGIIVVVGAIMLNARPTERFTWGIIVLVFSIGSFIGMGGYFIGAILGIAGGALSLSTHPISVKA